jgi:hypothetical protein
MRARLTDQVRLGVAGAVSGGHYSVLRLKSNSAACVGKERSEGVVAMLARPFRDT